MKRIDITIQESQIAKLKELSTKTGLTVSAMIRRALDIYFKKGKP